MRKNRSRILMVIVAMCLGSLFFLPMWKITLIAPQYPHGVQMHIHIDKIGGKDPGTLQNVNILNHYIGMKPIEPDSIPELKILPYVIGFFIAFALFAAVLDNKYLYISFVVIFIIGCAIGLYDFYLWEYDYGHNLDPNAPMKFDESFQPPLIGNKTIINFIAKSWPHTGGWLAVLGLVLSGIASYLKLKK